MMAAMREHAVCMYYKECKAGRQNDREKLNWKSIGKSGSLASGFCSKREANEPKMHSSLQIPVLS